MPQIIQSKELWLLILKKYAVSITERMVSGIGHMACLGY